MSKQQEVKFKNFEEQREHLQIETNKHKVSYLIKENKRVLLL